VKLSVTCSPVEPSLTSTKLLGPGMQKPSRILAVIIFDGVLQMEVCESNYIWLSALRFLVVVMVIAVLTGCVTAPWTADETGGNDWPDPDRSSGRDL
jgi:hypothetical protein